MPITTTFIDPGTIGSYADLLAMVPLWMDRDDLQDQVPNFIALFEPTLNRRLRTLSTEITTLWNVGPLPFVLPSDFRMLRSIWVEGSPDYPLGQVTPQQVGGIIPSQGGAELVIDDDGDDSNGEDYVIDDAFDTYEPGTGEGGDPRYYYLINRTLVLSPPPADFVNLRVIYHTRIPPLAETDPVNWLLAEHPDVYVWGVLKQASIFIRDPEAISACDTMFEQAVGEVVGASRRDKYGPGTLAPLTIVKQVGGVRI